MRSPQAQAILDKHRRQAASPRSRATSDATDRKRQTKPSIAASDGNAGPQAPPAPAAGLVEAYFDMFSGNFFSWNNDGEFQKFDREIFKTRLKLARYSTKWLHENGLNWQEAEIHRIANEHTVHWAGSLAGYMPGLHQIYSSRVLVTRGRKPIDPHSGDWPHLRLFLQALLGDQWRYFCAWIKLSLESLENGTPWTPGQLLAVAGPVRCGKSTLQTLITLILGGRLSSPYAYMSSGTNFNADIYGAEHGHIGDTNHLTDDKSRRNFGAAIKKLVVEPVHYIHTKGSTPITLNPFVRLSITLNNTPQALKVLPSLDSDVADKIILLQSHKVDWSKVRKGFANYQSWYNCLLAELPAFLWRLVRWPIPESIKGADYGVESFHDPDLAESLHSMTPEQRLMDTIDTYLFCDPTLDHWSGIAAQLDKELCKAMLPNTPSRVYTNVTHLGAILHVLAETHKDRVKAEKMRSRRVAYTILRDPVNV